MVEQFNRLYHCHKVHRNVTIFEDYEIIEGVRTLVRCSCPIHMYTEDGHKCDGLNDHNLPCGYAHFQEKT